MVSSFEANGFGDMLRSNCGMELTSKVNGADKMFRLSFPEKVCCLSLKPIAKIVPLMKVASYSKTNDYNNLIAELQEMRSQIYASNYSKKESFLQHLDAAISVIMYKIKISRERCIIRGIEEPSKTDIRRYLCRNNICASDGELNTNFIVKYH